MGLTARQFVDSLSTNGILTTSQVAALGEGLTEDAWKADAESIARELVQQRTLTKFQALNLYQGRGKGLVYGEYVVLDKLGEGGMGQVYKARHRRMKRVVALKVLPPSAVDSPKAVERFRQEVEVAAQLQHPNIVIAYDAGEAHGRHFLVMEYVDGVDLSSYVKQHGPLGVEQAANVVLQAARGLAYAHKLGIIHRDIKPSNLLLNREGIAKILDMGLARFDNPLADAGASHELTASGEVMGTVDYMAPEQATDTRTADARADIYALGCTLYRLLTGNPPYTGETMIQKILAHREQPIPSLRAVRGDVPDVLDRLYQKMLAKHVAERTPAMTQVVAGLEKLLGGISEERSSVMLGEEAPRDEKFDFSLLPPAAGPSGVLATPSSVGGSQLGGSKPGSTSGGMKSAPTQAPTAARAVPQAARVATAQRLPDAPEPQRGPSSLVLVGGGVAATVVVGAALFFALRKSDDPPAANLAAVVPATAPSSTTAPTAQVSATAAPPESKPTPSAVALAFPSPSSTAAAVSFFGGPAPPVTPQASASATVATPPVAAPTTPAVVVPAPAAAASTTGAAPSIPEPSSPPATTTDPVDRPSHPGVRVDLLKLVDVSRDCFVGAWKFDGSTLVESIGGGSSGSPRVQFPYAPPAAYELRITAVPTNNSAGPFIVSLIVGSSPTMFTISQGVSGIDTIGRERFNANATTVKDLSGLGPDIPLNLVIRVWPNAITAQVNGRRVVDWSGDTQQLGIVTSFANPDRTKLAVCCGYTRLTKCELAPLMDRVEPVPPTDAVAATAAKVKELVGELPPGAADAQKTFAAERLHREAAVTDDAALRYALLTEAAKLAAAAADVVLVSTILEDLGRCFDVDTAALMSKSLADVAGRTRPPKERAELIARLLATVAEQSGAEQYASAVPLVKAAATAASKTTDNDLKKEVKYREQEIEEYAKLFAAAETARETLAKSPEDGAANLAVGTYLAVARNDWSGALPHLVKANDATVRTAAQLETQSGTDASKLADVAAAWIEAADKAPLAAEAVFFEHARRLFADAAVAMKSVATSKMLARFKKVEGDVLRTAGSAFVKRHPASATAYAGHWYQFFPESMTWEQARDRCRELGGHLVCIETPAENQWVYQFAIAKFGQPDRFDFMIGATEEGHEGKFAWVNGSPFQFSDWERGRPAAGGAGNGCYVNRDAAPANYTKWMDDAVSRAPFLCEWDR